MKCNNCGKDFSHLYKVFPTNKILYKNEYYSLCGVCNNIMSGTKSLIIEEIGDKKWKKKKKYSKNF